MGNDNASYDINGISHKVSNIKIKNNNLVGDIEILDTPEGKMLQWMLDKGDNLYIASRGNGKINDKGIVENYNLISFDVVENGSSEKTKIFNRNYYIKEINKLKTK